MIVILELFHISFQRKKIEMKSLRLGLFYLYILQLVQPEIRNELKREKEGGVKRHIYYVNYILTL